MICIVQQKPVDLPMTVPAANLMPLFAPVQP
jgi:hypothetical protein